MEADWEFEVGGDAPVIDAAWAGFVDLQREPERVWDLPESLQLPGLADALIKLNAPASPVRTFKCDVWPQLDAGDFDLDEMDAPPSCSRHAMGCYIDLMPSASQQWNLPEMAADACKHLCGVLRSIPMRCCRTDLVIRHVFVNTDPADQQLMRLGVTAYLTSCGESSAEAMRTLQAALGAFADALAAT